MELQLPAQDRDRQLLHLAGRMVVGDSFQVRIKGVWCRSGSVKRTSRVDSQKAVSAIHKYVSPDLFVFHSVTAIFLGTPCRSGNSEVDGSDPPILPPGSARRGALFSHAPHRLGGSLPSHLSLREGDPSRSGSWLIISGWCPTRPQELRPLFHQGAPALEQIRAGIGRFHLILDKVRQRRLHDCMKGVRPQTERPTRSGPWFLSPLLESHGPGPTTAPGVPACASSVPAESSTPRPPARSPPSGPLAPPRTGTRFRPHLSEVDPIGWTTWRHF